MNVIATLSLGALPTGTYFHSLGYDTVAGEYTNMVILNIGDITLNLTKSFEVLKATMEYLNEWLTNSDMLSDECTVPNFMVAGSFKDIKVGPRFIRAHFSTGPNAEPPINEDTR